VSFLDLRVQDPAERRELLEAMDTVLTHGRIVLGPEVAQLEAEIARRCDRRFAIGVNSGTDALLLALRCLDLKPGDEVITTSLSWLATASAIRLAGGTPVFADIRDDLNIDPDSVARLISPRTKALLPVHYTGKVCRMDELNRVAQTHAITVIEDAAQAFGASLAGRPAGSFGTLGCFSMNPMKVLSALGEAGMVVTDREDLARRLECLRYHGTVNRERCVELSWNGRLDTLQAAFLLRRLQRFDALIARRREVASWYGDLLAGVVDLPVESPGGRDVYYTYQIRADRRDELKAHLESCGIETKIQHPLLMPEQPVHAGARGEWTRAARLRDRILCLPAHEKLERTHVEHVGDCVRGFYGK
jgi:dTDP-4-amino-4,6-dideoxygalactose transaminase